MNIRLQLPKLTDLRPRLTVIGVGGAGGNAVNNMIASGLQGVDFVVANTDAQALAASSAEHRIQLGVNLTEGLGAGSKPEIGEAAAEEALDDIRAQISGSHMVFIAAGMGGGTGTGAAAVIARIAKEAGVLAVGVVTKPFQFEGTRRMRVAEAGIAELKKNVDTLIVIPNQNLFRITNEKTTFAEAFVLADQVLYSGIACIVDLIVKEGLINLDFADVRTVLSGMGTAMMGTGEASGERRALVAAEEAISNPLLDDVSLRGARGLLLSITGGRSLTLYEVDEAASRVRQEVDGEANIIVGATFDDNLGDRIRVSIVASGMSRANEEQPAAVGTPAMKPALQHPRTNPVAVPQAAQPSDFAPPAAAPQPQQMPAATGWPSSQPAAASEPAMAQRQAPPSPQPRHQAQPSPAAAQLPPAWELPPSTPARTLTEALAPSPSASSAPRESWRGPGDVVIETGPPSSLGQAAQQAPQSGQHRHADEQREATGPAFAPAPPAEFKRPPQRRMPDVDDFPEVGQREYRAKNSAAYEQLAPPPLPQQHPPRVFKPDPAPAPQRKRGLFERITGRGKSNEPSESAYRGEQRDPRGDSDYPGQQRTGQGDGRPRDSRNAQEHTELPVFFKGERK